MGRLGLVGTVRYFIEEEIAAVPEKVGPPLSIVEISRNGTRWISEGVCGSQQHTDEPRQ
jgi:hypothetical protein